MSDCEHCDCPMEGADYCPNCGLKGGVIPPELEHDDYHLNVVPAPHSEYTGLYPMSAAEKNGKSILLYLKDRIPMDAKHIRVWDGLVFVGLHHPLPDDGFDSGWMFAAPVGHGGFPDAWFKGWTHIPSEGRKK